MTDARPHRPSPGGSSRRGESGMLEDIHALRTSTERDLPSLERSLTMARRRTTAAREESWMSTIRTLMSRPGFAVAAALGVVALLLGIVPIPYQKTTAHDVSLKVSGGRFDPAHVGEVAKELKAALGAEHVNVSALDESGAMTF